MINDNGGALVATDFAFMIDDAHSAGSTVVLFSGNSSAQVTGAITYHIFEDEVSNYSFVDTVCTRDSDSAVVYTGNASSPENYVDLLQNRVHVGHFAVSLGESYTCTVTNDDVAQA